MKNILLMIILGVIILFQMPKADWEQLTPEQQNCMVWTAAYIYGKPTNCTKAQMKAYCKGETIYFTYECKEFAH